MRSNGIAAVQVKNGDEWNTITNQEEVEPAIMNNNSARFSLTEKTPLMSEHMSSKLGFLAETDYANNILNGNFKTEPDMDEYTNKFLHFIGKRSQLPTISADVLREDLLHFGRERERKHHHPSQVDILDTTKQHHVVTKLVRYMHRFSISPPSQEYD